MTQARPGHVRQALRKRAGRLVPLNSDSLPFAAWIGGCPRRWFAPAYVASGAFRPTRRRAATRRLPDVADTAASGSSRSAPTGEQRPARMAEHAYERLRDDIISLRIEPGRPLDDKLLSAELGVGLTPVRDAVKRLALERLVVTYPRRGTFASEITVSDERWLTELRLDLEGLAAALAAHRATAAERATLTSLVRPLAEDRADRLTTEHQGTDHAIHRALYSAAHNPYLECSLTQYLNLTIRIWHYGLRRVPTHHSSGRDQQEVVAAVVRGDADAARTAARAHLSDFSASVRSLLAR